MPKTPIKRHDKYVNKRKLGLSLIWLAVMTYGLLTESSVHTGDAFGVAVRHMDKLAHFGLFFGQFWLFGRSVQALPIKLFWLVCISLAVCLALVSELSQGYLTTTRTMDIWDAVADMLGAMTALVVLQWHANFYRKRFL